MLKKWKYNLENAEKCHSITNYILLSIITNALMLKQDFTAERIGLQLMMIFFIIIPISPFWWFGL